MNHKSTLKQLKRKPLPGRFLLRGALLGFGLLAASADARAQSMEDRISIRTEGRQSLAGILQRIDQQTGYSFSFLKEDFEAIKAGPVEFKSERLETVLKTLQQEYHIEYVINGNVLLLRIAAPKAAPRPAVGYLQGRLTDEKTGEGQHIDMALFDCMSGVLANQAMNYLASGKAPKRMGNAHPNISPYQTLPVEDGYFIIACGNDGQFGRLVGLLGLAELASDERFVTNSARVANRAALTDLLEAKTRQWKRDDLLAKLTELGVPAGPINTVADVFADPQFQARGMKIDPQGVPGLRTPIRFSDADLKLDRRSPKLGEHSAEIRAELEK